jgi:ribosomal protein L11 methyltransferase
MIYVLEFTLAREVPLRMQGELSQSLSRTQSRGDVIARFNDHCQDWVDPESGDPEFYGVTEGVLLAEEAHERGYETESWVLDAGEAPHERDWIGQEETLALTAYFRSKESAEAARKWLLQEFDLATDPVVSEQEEQDWNATWKASFQGIDVSPTLKILPPWHEDFVRDPNSAFERGIVAINPGAGFGTGTHETTQMCLQVLDKCGDAQKERSQVLHGKTVLDFGSGSGILGITAAKLGARVYCVEVDRLANENAIENAKLNGLVVEGPQAELTVLEKIPDFLKTGQVDILLANILRPILLQFAPEIRACLKPESELILSGLIESDLDPVIRAYSALEPFEIQKFEKNEWRALWCRKRGATGTRP